MIQVGCGKCSTTPGLVLWNPSIRRSRVLPNSPVFPEEVHFYIDLGFGFDPSTNDYKHVRLVLRGYSTLHRVLVYTVGTGVWRTVEFQGKGMISEWCWDFNYDSPWIVVYCKGVLYFVSDYTLVGDKEKKELVSFDLSDEAFSSTSLPVDDDVVPDKYADEEDEKIAYSDESADKVVTLVDGGSTLGVFYLLSTSGCIWVLGSNGEWSKRYVFRGRIQMLIQEDFTRPKVLYLKNGEIVTLYDLESDYETNLVTTPQALDWRHLTNERRVNNRY
ncbi:hypothetical protein V2J09_016070 [Rumex salicifolius]